MGRRRTTDAMVLIGCMFWVGLPATALLKLSSDGRAGVAGGPPNFFVPAILFGGFLSVLAAAAVLYLMRNLRKPMEIAVAAGVFVSSLAPLCALAGYVIGP